MQNDMFTLTFKAIKIKIVKVANSLDPNEVVHNELPHLDLHCLPSGLLNLNMI